MRSRWLGAIALAACAPFLLLTLLDFPRVAFDIDHDLSSSAAIEYFASRGVQFGTDLVQNVGPLGWAYQTSVYAGYLHPQKLLLGGLVRAACVVLVLWACTRFEARWARAAWLLAVVGLVPFGAPGVDFLDHFQEGWAYLNVYLAGLGLLVLGGRRFSAAGSLPLLALLAVLALEKHTLLAIAAFSVGAVLLERLRRPGDRSALAVGLAFLGWLALFWNLAGQHLANLPAFLLGVARFGGGYNEAMALAATPSVTWLGAGVAGGLAALIAWRTLERSQSPSKSAIDALVLLALWKHGFVRADPAHTTIFFVTAVPLALLFGLARDGHPGGARTRPALRSAAIGIVAAGLAALCAVGILRGFPGTSYETARVTELWSRNLAWLRGPSWKTGELGAALRRNEVDYDLGPMKRVVGTAPIGFFGDRPGWVLLNRLNYVTRPMPIPFAAANAALRRRNEAYYRDPARTPDFVLLQLDPTTPDLVTLDDGLALGALFDNYHPLSSGGDLVLLRRNEPDQIRTEAVRTPLVERALALGEDLPLAEFAGRWVWLEADVRPSGLGRMRSFALRPAPLRIRLEVEGREKPISRRYVASMGTSGFLLSPYIESSEDFANAYRHGGALLHAVRAVRFECAPEDRRFFEGTVRVRLFEGRAPPSAPAS